MPRTDTTTTTTTTTTTSKPGESWGGGGGRSGGAAAAAAAGGHRQHYVPPPPIPEQKRLRQIDPTIVPSPPYLLISKFLDFACASVPVLRGACPSDGWRSAFPYVEWVTFPAGRLSHSFDGRYSAGDVVPYLTYGEFVAGRRGDGRSTTTATATIRSFVVDAYDYSFRTDSTSLSDLTDPTALAVLFVLVLLMRSIKGALLPRFSSIGRRLGRAAHGRSWEVDNPDRIIKFGEYVHRLLYHTAVSVYGIWYFRDKSWWDESRGGTTNLWIGHPNQPIGPGMAWYYLVQGAYNVDALISLAELSFVFEFVNPFAYSSALDFLVEREHVVDERQRKEQVRRMMTNGQRGATALWTPLFRLRWSDAVRGDFREMMSHHLVTNALIFFSSYYRLTRAGSMVFLIHDVSDVPIDMSKLANFVKWKVATIVCFVIMVLMWIVTRLTIFPFVICKAVLTESREYLVLRGTLDPALHDAYYLLFYALLGALVLLHVTWFLILLRIGWTLVSTGERHDYSEHKGGERQKKDS
ncbi:hypothetical protein ACHAW5_000713 [Stephanodiscus triporus]|uniref:TLC domain-containing protein n=1 Tax=Stephanodiscus triporus TaxID=2934178 RepID=A0ABD3PSE8_9STRA